MTETKTTRIFWKEPEKKILCDEAARLLSGNLAYSKLDALKQAQQTKLPPGRRRYIHHLAGFDWFINGVESELKILRMSLAKTEAPPLIDIPAKAHAAPSAESELGPFYTLLRRRLVTEIADLISDVLQEVEWPQLNFLPQAGAAQQATEILKRYGPGIAESKQDKKPTVLVVGLKGSQMEIVKRAQGHRLDLRFIGATDSLEHLKHMAKQVDVAVSMVGFVNHSHTEILGDLAKRQQLKKHILNPGGITKLKRLLDDIGQEPVPI